MQPDRFRQSAPETLVDERASNWGACIRQRSVKSGGPDKGGSTTS